MVEIRRPKKPYGEHRKEFAAARGLEASQGEQATPPGTGSRSVGEALGESAVNGVPPPASPTTKPAVAADAKLRLKFTVHAPLPGTFDYFDRAAALMGDAKALRLVLARAFDQLEAAVAAGKDVRPYSYPADPSLSVNTSRHVSPALYAKAKTAIDPMDLLPPGSFGRELAMSALVGSLKGVLMRD